MRPHYGDYDEFDDFDEFCLPDVRSIRHMANERRLDELRSRQRRRRKLSAKNRWYDDEWDSFDDYDDNDFDDYNADEFDAYSGLSIDNH